jgi:hypothetical protein
MAATVASSGRERWAVIGAFMGLVFPQSVSPGP